MCFAEFDRFEFDDLHGKVHWFSIVFVLCMSSGATCWFGDAAETWQREPTGATVQTTLCLAVVRITYTDTLLPVSLYTHTQKMFTTKGGSAVAYSIGYHFSGGQYKQINDIYTSWHTVQCMLFFIHHCLTRRVLPLYSRDVLITVSPSSFLPNLSLSPSFSPHPS